jgi:hypothetical protein
MNFVSAGAAAAAFTSVRNAWMKIFGVCPAMPLHGNVRIAGIKMGLAISDAILDPGFWNKKAKGKGYRA